MTRDQKLTLGILVLLLVGWVGFIVTAHALIVRTEERRLACEAGRAGLDRVSDSLFLSHAPACHG